ncbi:Sulfotransferase domain [Macleaya cordata]|uniref:Sulfotransferase n=1 Tax=Macleaya cordata TaxID=56857 RepID=A0A200R2H8_MACCD|nr:Sulfotransferase domain [Macleaya cordata]
MAVDHPAPKYLHEEEGLTQETKDFLSSLPRDKSWVLNHFYQYQGFWHTTKQLVGVMTCQQQFKAHETDLFLVSTPKSGTTWLKAMAFATVNRVRYTNNFTHNHPLLTSSPHELVPFLEQKYIDNSALDLSGFTSPRLFSTHMAHTSLPESVKDSKCKLVYICRDPKATFVSYWHFANKLRPKNLGPNSLEEAFERFCRGVTLFGPFWDHVLGYWKESLERPERVCFLKFEAMKKEPKLHLRKLAEFLGYPFSLEEENQRVPEEILRLCSFENLSNLEVNKTGKLATGEENSAFFRRGEVEDWVNFLTQEMIEHLDQITEQKLFGSGLKFN